MRAFEQSIGASNGLIGRAINKNSDISASWVSKIIETYPELDINWLLTGELSHETPVKSQLLKLDQENHVLGIPLIPVDAMAGYFAGERTVMLHDCEHFVVPSFHNADFLITVRGDSMMPRYNSGDLVACKMLGLSDLFFQWGKVYVIDTDQGALIKKVEQGNSTDTIKLVSENPAYSPFELPRACVYHIAIVLGLIRSE